MEIELLPKKKKYKLVLAVFIIGILIAGFVIKTRQENREDTLYVARMTDSLIGSDGRRTLTGKECVELTKYFRHFAAKKLHMSFDDIKKIMKVYRDSGGMANLRTSFEYKQKLTELLNILDDLRMVFPDEDYVALTKEMMFFYLKGYSLSSAKKMILDIHYTALQSGMSYGELKNEMYRRR